MTLSSGIQVYLIASLKDVHEREFLELFQKVTRMISEGGVLGGLTERAFYWNIAFISTFTIDFDHPFYFNILALPLHWEKAFFH